MPTNDIDCGSKGYFMVERDNGSIYETVGRVTSVDVEVVADTRWSDNAKYFLPHAEETLTIRLLRDRSYLGPKHRLFSPKRIIHNGPATIVFWWDGTKTVVKCHDEDYDPEKGLAMALCRKLWGRCQTERFVRMIEEQVGR